MDINKIVIIIIISLLIVFTLFLIFNRETFDNYLYKDKILTVVFETDPNNKNYKKLLKLLDIYGYNYKIIGLNSKWEGFGTKTLQLLEFYKKLDKSQIILQLDSRDIIINEHYNELFEKYIYNYYNKIIISGEYSCCVYPLNNSNNLNDFITVEGTRKNNATNYEYEGPNYSEIWSLKMKNIRDSKGIYSGPYNLNAGMMIGPADKLISLYESLNISKNEDDQALLTQYFILNPDTITIDYKQLLFANSENTNEGSPFEYTEYNNKWSIVEKDNVGNVKYIVPSIIQTPGKKYEVYDILYQYKTQQK